MPIFFKSRAVFFLIFLDTIANRPYTTFPWLQMGEGPSGSVPNSPIERSSGDSRASSNTHGSKSSRGGLFRKISSWKSSFENDSKSQKKGSSKSSVGSKEGSSLLVSAYIIHQMYLLFKGLI